SSKLAQEAQGVFPERPDRRDVVAELRSPLEAAAEGEAAPLVGVEADVREHARIDHPGAAELDPAGPLARRAALSAADAARDARPLHTMSMGGGVSSRMWICAGDVSVGRTVRSSRKNVSRGERVGWHSGNASLSKLYSTVSTSRSSRIS